MFLGGSKTEEASKGFAKKLFLKTLTAKTVRVCTHTPRTPAALAAEPPCRRGSAQLGNPRVCGYFGIIPSKTPRLLSPPRRGKPLPGGELSWFSPSWTSRGFNQLLFLPTTFRAFTKNMKSVRSRFSGSPVAMYSRAVNSRPFAGLLLQLLGGFRPPRELQYETPTSHPDKNWPTKPAFPELATKPLPYRGRRHQFTGT